MLNWAQRGGGGVVRRFAFAVGLGGALILAASPGRGEDSDETRYYLGIRFGEFTPGIIKAHDVGGGSLGVNIGKHLGFEFALDSYEVKVGDVSEMSVLGLVPNVRLRYPLFDDRLTPYLLAGVGMAVTQANDARQPVEWRGGKDGVQVAGSVGGGVEYFIADNIALALEGKGLISGDIDYTSGGQAGSENISSALVTLGFRLFYPELHPTENAAVARDASARFYLALRSGGALLMNSQPFPGVTATSEQSIFGSNFTQQFGVSAGANIGRYAGIELALENYELRLSLPNLGGIGEYAVFPVTVQPRLRYPLFDGRLEPYVMAGIGAEYAQINDRSGAGNEIVVFARDLTVIGAFGAGLEYFLMNNVSIGGAAKYVISRGHTFQIEGSPKLQGNFDSFMLSLQIRVVLFNV